MANTENTDIMGNPNNTENTDSKGKSEKTENTDSKGEPEKTENTDSMGNPDNKGNSENMENQEKPANQENPAHTGNAGADGNPTPEEGRPLTAKEKHEIKVREWNETAKDPSLYETYEARESTVFPGVHMFAAKRRGRGHVMGRKPCQDDCMIAEGRNCVILVDADGVSACERSDEGSRIACEVLVELVRSAEDHSKSEEEFVKLLQSGQFRDRLIASWLKKVISVIREGSEEWKDSVSEIEKFGTTILFTVITEHWYVAGNLGDGQVLFFNRDVSVKLRCHTPKESSRVYCLVSPKCALDGFQMAAYPRALFDGILMSTDGMYDFLEPSNHFYRYGLELKERFMKAGEPLQPFCYTEGDKPMRDFSEFRSMDDCSIVLSYDIGGCTDELGTNRKEIEKRQDVVRLLRLQGDTALFETYKKPDLSDVCVSRPSAVLPRPLKEAVVEPSLEEWDAGGFHFSRYAPAAFDTVESYYSNGLLREKRKEAPEASAVTARLCSRLNRLREELRSMPLVLGDGAQFLIQYDEEKDILILRKEALAAAREEEETKENTLIRDYFRALLGTLSSGHKAIPLFDTGFLTVGRIIERFDQRSVGGDRLLCVTKSAQGMMLKNMSDTWWMLKDGSVIQPGQTVPLTDGLEFALGDDAELDEDAEPVVYSFISREKL